MSVGKNVPRKDSPGKVSGAARYVDDLSPEGCWFGATVRSAHPHARVLGFELPPDEDWSELVMASAKDLPGRNLVALIFDDQPLLADGYARHIGEPLLLLAGPDRERVRRAAQKVKVQYEVLPAITDLRSALEHGSAPGCVAPKAIHIVRGDLEQGFADADLIVEGHYWTGHQEQLYIEPNGFIARWTSEGVLEVEGSLQCPYYVHKAMKEAFNLPDDKVRVIGTVTGGGFGGKEDFPSVLAGHAALLSLKAGRPIKMVYTRAEDFSVTTKRHPTHSYYKMGVKRDGTLTACYCDFDIDSGAYITLSSVVLSRGSIHSTGPYAFPHVEVHGRAWATHTPPNGAFRGFGAPQAYFALERHLDRVAEALQLDPAELRRKNALSVGGMTGTGQILKESVSTLPVLEAALERSEWVMRRQERSRGVKRRGLGMALYMHGTGFTGSGERRLKTLVGLELYPDGSVEIRTSSTDMGQGTATVFPQILATAAGFPYEACRLAPFDTFQVPDSGPTVASRTVAIVGRVVQWLGEALQAKLLEAAAVWFGGVPEEYQLNERGLVRVWSNERLLSHEALASRWIGERGPLRLERGYQLDPTLQWDEVDYRGDAYPAYAFGCTVVEVEVDTDTLEVDVQRVTAVHDIGTLIHPLLAAGQVEGGLAQAIGYGLLEEVKWRDGKMLNPSFTNYIIPTALDLPELEVSFIENPYSHGPFGAKGVGELPMNGAAPALANAIFDAVGADVCEIPVTPERILKAQLQARAEGRAS
ncbi:MAG: xanthine dehydrogenase family protein molybdopterin-binding subunit [Myxococcota bacterium]